MPFFDSLNQNSGAIQAITTVILTIITGLYAWLTYKIASEAEKSRKDARLPELRIEMSGPIMSNRQKFFLFKAINTGRGTALNIRGNFLNKDLNFGNLDTGEDSQEELYLTDEEIDSITKLQVVDRIFTVTYQDVFSRELSTVTIFGDTNRGNFVEFETKNWFISLP